MEKTTDNKPMGGSIMENKNIVEKCRSIFVTMVIVYIATVGFVGAASAKESVSAEAEKQDSEPILEQAVASDMASILAVPSSSTYTGCLSNISRWNLPKGVLYYVKVGTASAGKCLSGDKKVRFVDSTYINTLETRLSRLESLLTGVTRSGNDIYINKANVHIRDGSGSTDGTVNGLGNLIIGYNEPRTSGNNRTGSHNLIIGSQNNYKSYGGLVSGFSNEISGSYSSVSGGLNNIASGSFSSVSGGSYGIASGFTSSVSGGAVNTASGDVSSVSGGSTNIASGAWSSVSGGRNNTASYFDSSVSGGKGNKASGEWSSVSGGYLRSAMGEYDWVAGGLFQDQ